MALILVVEDEKRIRDILSDTILREGHEVLLAEDGREAMDHLRHNSVDLMILDIMMPGMDGFAVCRAAREISRLPIIILTAKQAEGDKLKGYELGADDYMTKPFSPKVLMAKMRALLKRAHPSEEDSSGLRAGGILLDTVSREVRVHGEPVPLTHTEFELLLLFMCNPRQIFSRDQMLNRIWGYDYEGTGRTVDVHVKNLRQKLGGEGRHIVTLIRSGYKFEVMPDE